MNSLNPAGVALITSLSWAAMVEPNTQSAATNTHSPRMKTTASAMLLGMWAYRAISRAAAQSPMERRMAPNNKIRMSLSCHMAPASAAMTRMTSNRPVNVPSVIVPAPACGEVRRGSDIRMEYTSRRPLKIGRTLERVWIPSERRAEPTPLLLSPWCHDDKWRRSRRARKRTRGEPTPLALNLLSASVR